jgi:hypothetical protein
MWGLVTLLITLLNSRLRKGSHWFIAYIGAAIQSGVMEPFAFPENVLSFSAALYKFGLNIINISSLVYLILAYFVKQKIEPSDHLPKKRRKPNDSF